MIDCCIDAMAVYEQRKHSDKNPRIVKYPMPNKDSDWSFYLSDNYVSNILSDASPLPPYEGNLNNAPAVYKMTDFKTDQELMDEVDEKVN